MTLGRRLPILALILCAAPALGADPYIPPQLETWVPWVLEGRKAELCPRGVGIDAECAWPTSLELEVQDRAGSFRATWQRFDEGRIVLPGDARHFPQEVRLNGNLVPVLNVDGVPTVHVPAGIHVVTGTFSWARPPNSLRVPQQSGLLSVRVRDQQLTSPRVQNHTLYFVEQQDTEEATPHGDALDVRVHRKIQDTVPLEVETTIRLEVSGKSREVLLGRPLLEGGVPMAVEGELPARLEPDGRLRVAVRAGTWSLRVDELHLKETTELKRQAPRGPWSEEEVWAFEAHPDLRMVTVVGVPGIDPAQTTLPAELQHLPTYAVPLDTPFRLEVERRGDASPPADQIRLSRTLWLDFDGKGFTSSDTFDAQLHRSWRLTAAEGTHLGRVSVGGEPQFITRLAGGEPPGVEVRHGIIQVSADSRVDRAMGGVPAVGWAHDVQSLQTTLNLPAGWSLLHAGGVDRADTWVSRWTLLDIFLLVIIAFATGRLYGWPGGLLALLALGLNFHESNAPKLIWLLLLALEALLRVLPKNAFAKTLGVFRWGTFAILLILLVSYSVEQIQKGLFPVLDQDHALATEVATFATPSMAPQAVEAEMASEPGSKALQEFGAANDMDMKEMDRSKRGWGRSGGGSYSTPSVKKSKTYDRDTVIQTGPGLPSWSWSSIQLVFSGPVQQGQLMRLWLLPPWLNQTLAFVRVLLFALLGVLLIGRWPKRLGGAGGQAAHAAVGLLLVAGLLSAAPARAADLPSNTLLEDLRERLLRGADCNEDCTALNRLSLELSPSSLRARMRVSAEAQGAFRLPGSRDGWQPESVRINGAPATALRRVEGGSGVLYVVLPRGVHELVMEGPLPNRSTLSLHLPSIPQFTEVSARGWTVEGLNDEGRAFGDLELSRVETDERPVETSVLQQPELPPYLVVHRSLVLGLEWSVETTIERLSPTGRAVVTEIPLLPGESVITPEIEVRDGKVQLNLPPASDRVTWSSRLEKVPSLVLKAPEDAGRSEVWSVRSEPRWHVVAEGLPPVHREVDHEERIPTYRPWPGEALTLEVHRPEGIGGRTLTIDKSELILRPGQRNTEVTLNASLRTSRGGPHVIQLPEGATLSAASLQGRTLPLRQEGRAVTLPLAPGDQRVELTWSQAEGIRTTFRTPEVDLGVPSVNASQRIEVPRDRWVLFTSGPRVGPAILFWPTFVVLLVVAFALSRIRWAPLRAWEWLLLTIGLSQLPVLAAAIVPAWLLALGQRKRAPELGTTAFNFRQLGIALLTLVALGVLVVAIHSGLLSTPEMRIEGNGSYAYSLAWYQDRAAATLPTATLFSAPILVFRLVMLAWALWLAASLLRWLRFGWSAFTEGGLWKKIVIQTQPLPAVPVPPAPPPASPPPTGPAS